MALSVTLVAYFTDFFPDCSCRLLALVHPPPHAVRVRDLAGSFDTAIERAAVRPSTGTYPLC